MKNMILKDIIENCKREHPDLEKIYISYYCDIYDTYTGECLYPEEFMGCAIYHDNHLDDSIDLNNYWSLDDEIEDWKLKKEEKPGIYTLFANIGRVD